MSGRNQKDTRIKKIPVKFSVKSYRYQESGIQKMIALPPIPIPEVIFPNQLSFFSRKKIRDVKKKVLSFSAVPLELWHPELSCYPSFFPVS